MAACTSSTAQASHDAKRRGSSRHSADEEVQRRSAGRRSHGQRRHDRRTLARCTRATPAFRWTSPRTIPLAVNFPPEGYLVVILADPDEAQRLKRHSCERIPPRDIKLYRGEQDPEESRVVYGAPDRAEQVCWRCCRRPGGPNLISRVRPRGSVRMWVRLPDEDNIPKALGYSPTSTTFTSATTTTVSSTTFTSPDGRAHEDDQQPSGAVPEVLAPRMTAGVWRSRALGRRSFSLAPWCDELDRQTGTQRLRVRSRSRTGSTGSGLLHGHPRPHFLRHPVAGSPRHDDQ